MKVAALVLLVLACSTDELGQLGDAAPTPVKMLAPAAPAPDAASSPQTSPDAGTCQGPSQTPNVDGTCCRQPLGATCCLCATPAGDTCCVNIGRKGE